MEANPGVGRGMNMLRAAAVPILIALLVAACGSAAATPPPQPGSGGPLTVAQLKYVLIDQLGPLWFCDPDQYPVARGDEADLAVKRFAEVKADSDAFAAIATHLGIPAAGEPNADQKLAIYRAWKQLNAARLEPIGAGRYRFDYLAMPKAGAAKGTRTAGTIDARGAVTIEQQAPAGQPPCPICLARGTRIATPDGDVPVEAVRVGERVWSLDGAGRRIVAVVLAVGQTPVPATHRIVRLALDDGRVLRASPRHQLADSRPLGDIRRGDEVDGATVVWATLEAYAGGATFDLLPSGPTGVYIADGVPLRSTLEDAPGG